MQRPWAGYIRDVQFTSVNPDAWSPFFHFTLGGLFTEVDKRAEGGQWPCCAAALLRCLPAALLRCCPGQLSVSMGAVWRSGIWRDIGASVATAGSVEGGASAVAVTLACCQYCTDSFSALCTRILLCSQSPHASSSHEYCCALSHHTQVLT